MGVGINGQEQSNSSQQQSSRFTFYVLRFRRNYPAIAAFLVGVLYLAGLVAMPPDAMTHHDTGAKYLQVRNLRITTSGLDYSINYPARPLDPDLQYVPFREKQYYIDGQERIYLQWPIFLGLLTRIPWKLMGFWGLYVVPLLAGVGACWATYLLALAAGVPRRVAWLAVPLVGLATPLAIYSMLFFEHTLADMLVALSLMFGLLAVPAGEPEASVGPQARRGVLLRLFSSSRRRIAACAALMAVAVYFRSELYLLAGVMALALAFAAWRAVRWRRLFWTWLGAFVVALVPLWAFYAITEGTLLPLHATWYFAGSEGATTPGEPVTFALPALRYIVQAGWGVVPDFLFGPQGFESSPVYPLWVGVLGVAGTALCVLSALLRRVGGALGSLNVRLGVFGVGLACVMVSTLYILVIPQSYHNLHGFLLASPFVALALWPPQVVFTRDGWTRHGLLYGVTLLHVGLHVLIISALSGLGPISRSEWGQRYLLAAYPGLVALALLAGWRIWTEYAARPKVERAGTYPERSLATTCVLLSVGLGLVGLFFSVRGYTVLYDERTQVRSWLTLSESLPGRTPLITNDWFLPLNLAADFYTRPIMLAESDNKLAHWANDVRERGVTEFGFMTDKPESFAGAWVSRVPGLSADGSPVQVRGIWLQRYKFGVGAP
jgi:hypothetical protein